MERILVLGATGTVGGTLVRSLRQRNVTVRAASRRAAPRQPLPLGSDAPRVGGSDAENCGLEWTRFDFDDPTSFAPALRDVDRVLLIARPGDDAADRASLPFIDEMKRAGVRHVVNLTAMGVEQLAVAALRRIELHLEDSGLAYTHLRPNWFMQVLSAGPLGAAIRDRALLAIPAAASRVSYIDARDIADVAAVALTSERLVGRALTLTGPVALSHDEVVQCIAEACGRPVRYLPVSEDDARTALLGSGFTPARVDRLLGFYRLLRAGACEPVSADVMDALGRPPRTFASFAREHRVAWEG